MIACNFRQAGTGEQFLGLAPSQQHCILIERAAQHGKPRQRIERVVLDQADGSTGTDHAPHFGNESGPVRRRNVVDHADRESQVERIIVIGKARRRIGTVVGPGIVGFRPLDRFTGNVAAAQFRKQGAAERVQSADATADIQRARRLSVPVETARGDNATQDIDLCLQEKIVFQPGEADGVLDDVAIIRAVTVEQRRYQAAPFSCTAVVSCTGTRSKPVSLSTT